MWASTAFRALCRVVLVTSVLWMAGADARGHHPPGVGHHPPGRGHRGAGKGGHRADNVTPVPAWRESLVTKPTVDYCDDHLSLLRDGGAPLIRIRFDAACGSRWRSDVAYSEASFESEVKTPAGDTGGLVTSLYLSFLEGAMQDEIDFEWLGNRKRGVQTNYYVKGVGGRERFHDLQFDTSASFHNYTIYYAGDRIEWFVDGLLLRREEKMPGAPFPDQPLYLYASVWNAQYINAGGWAGFYGGKDVPYFASYRDTKIKTLR